MQVENLKANKFSVAMRAGFGNGYQVETINSYASDQVLSRYKEDIRQMAMKGKIQQSLQVDTLNEVTRADELEGMYCV